MDFTKLLRLLIPLTVEGVLKVRRNSGYRLVEKFKDLEFYTRNVIQEQNQITIELQILDEDLLYYLLAGEANKFLLASRLSHHRASQVQENNAAWQIIEHYYAAYYSAHYLLRITGTSLTNLDSQATDVIIRSKLDDIQGTQIPSGLYVLRYNDDTKTNEARKMA